MHRECAYRCTVDNYHGCTTLCPHTVGAQSNYDKGAGLFRLCTPIDLDDGLVAAFAVTVEHNFPCVYVRVCV